MPFAGMFMGNNKLNNKFGILQCYYESHNYNTNPLITNPDWQGGERDDINFDNPVNKRYLTDCSRVQFNKERTISYWVPPDGFGERYVHSHLENTIINWSDFKLDGGWICGIKWKDEIGSVTVKGEGGEWYRISDDGINWHQHTFPHDNNFTEVGGQTFAVYPTTRYFILGMSNNSTSVWYMKINPIIPKTEWIAPKQNSLVTNIFALRGYHYDYGNGHAGAEQVANKLMTNINNAGNIFKLRHHNQENELASDNNKIPNSFKGRNFVVSESGNFMAVVYYGDLDRPSIVRCFIKGFGSSLKQHLTAENGWTKIGQDIIGSGITDDFWGGHLSVSTIKSHNPDPRGRSGKTGLKIVIGCPMKNTPNDGINFGGTNYHGMLDNDANGVALVRYLLPGRVCVYYYNVTTDLWEQTAIIYPPGYTLGNTWYRDETNDPLREEFGYTVELNNSGNRLFIGSPLYRRSKAGRLDWCGCVRVYNSNGESFDYSDIIVTNNIYFNNEFTYDSHTWRLPGMDDNRQDLITGGFQHRRGAGASISINNSGDRIIIGNPFYSGPNPWYAVPYNGRFEIWFYENGVWVLSAEHTGSGGYYLQDTSSSNEECMGWSVAMSGDGNTVAAGAPFSWNKRGEICVFIYDHYQKKWNPFGNYSSQLGATIGNNPGYETYRGEIYGYNDNDFLGWSIALHHHGNVLIAGAPRLLNSEGDTLMSYVKVYSTSNLQVAGYNNEYKDTELFDSGHYNWSNGQLVATNSLARYGEYVYNNAHGELWFSAPGMPGEYNALEEAGNYNNDITFLETINTGTSSAAPKGDYPYYHEKSGTPIDLIFEFSRPIWCNGFQYLHDTNYGDSTAINEINIFSSDTLHSSYNYINYPQVYGTVFNDASWNMERFSKESSRVGFSVSQSGANNSLNPFSLIRNVEDGTIIPFTDSTIEWVPRGPVKYVKISIQSNLAYYNTSTNSFDSSYISIKHLSLKIADPLNIIEVNNTQKRHISLNYTAYDENPIETGSDHSQPEVYYQYNVNNGVHKPGLTFDFNNNGLLNSSDIAGAVPTGNWNNIVPFEKKIIISGSRNWSSDGYTPGTPYTHGGQYSVGFQYLIEPSTYSEFNDHSKYYLLRLYQNEFIRNHYYWDTYKIGNRTWTFFHYNNNNFRPSEFNQNSIDWRFWFMYEGPNYWNWRTSENMREYTALKFNLNYYRLNIEYKRTDGGWTTIINEGPYNWDHVLGPVYYRIIFDYSSGSQVVTIARTKNTSPQSINDWDNVYTITDMYVAPDQKWHYEFGSYRERMYVDIMNADGILDWNDMTSINVSRILEYPNNISIKDNNGYLLGDILRHNSVYFDKDKYFNFGTNILFNGQTSFGGEISTDIPHTIIDIPQEFQDSGYVVRVYWGAYIHGITNTFSWGIIVSDDTGYSKKYWIRPAHDAIYAQSNTPHFPLDGNDAYRDTSSQSVSGYIGSKHTGYNQANAAGYASNYSYYDNNGAGLTGPVLHIFGGGFSGIQITQK